MTIPLIRRTVIGKFVIYERKPKPRGLTKYCIGHDGDTQDMLRDFGKYSTAVRWAKAQLPRETPHVVVHIEDGLVRSVIATQPTKYTLIENTTDEGPGVVPIRMETGESQTCYHWTADATVNPARVKEVLHAVELHQTKP